MRADDRRDTGVSWCYTTEAHKWSVNLTVQRGQQHMGRQISSQVGILINTAHTHTAGCNRTDMCAQHALKSHTNRQLPAICCECAIVTLRGSVLSVSSHRRVFCANPINITSKD